MPKSALTGTEKKAKKYFIHKAEKREKLGVHGLRKGMEALEEVQKGKHAIPSDLNEIIKRFEKAGRGAEKIFAPIREEAMHRFQTETQPQLGAALGGRQLGASSAMKQALSASQENLQRSLASDFAQLQSNLAQNLLGQSQQAKLQNLNAYLSSASGMMGQGTSPVAQGISQQAQYLPSSGQPSFGRQLLGTGLGIAGSIIGNAIAPGIGGVVGGAIGGGVGTHIGHIGGTNQL